MLSTVPWTFIGNSDRDFSSRLSEGNVYRTGQGIALQGQRVDLLVDKAVVVELKSVIRFEEIHRAQVISYLRTLRLRGIAHQFPSAAPVSRHQANRAMRFSVALWFELRVGPVVSVVLVVVLCDERILCPSCPSWCPM